MLPARIARVPEKEAEQRAVQLLTELGMAERLTHKPNQLSGGEKQRVAAARAMMMSPDVILADEPSGSLDESNKNELHKLLLQMREQYGQTIIIVTHDKELKRLLGYIKFDTGKSYGDLYCEAVEDLLRKYGKL